jgi:hypothetical protein
LIFITLRPETNKWQEKISHTKHLIMSHRGNDMDIVSQDFQLSYILLGSRCWRRVCVCVCVCVCGRWGLNSGAC